MADRLIMDVTGTTWYVDPVQAHRLRSDALRSPAYPCIHEC